MMHTGCVVGGAEAAAFGFHHRLVEPETLPAEAQAKAICMRTKDFERAYHAFAARQKPVFEGH